MGEDWSMLELYHGSDVEIVEIDLSKGHINKDFGKGFYLTDIRKQADDMAKRRARMTRQGTPIVTTFLFDENNLVNGLLNVKIFNEVSEEWAEFILNNRKASISGFRHEYDIVVGPVADDGVVLQLDLYEQHYITLAELVKRLEFRELNRQYFFGTEKAVKTLRKL